jgi:hypothetical protein
MGREPTIEYLPTEFGRVSDSTFSPPPSVRALAKATAHDVRRCGTKGGPIPMRTTIRRCGY